MDFKSSFIQEMNYLRQLAKYYSKQYPDLAQYFDSSGDAEVERLLEAFTFITTGLQHKINDEFPEVTQPVLSRLSPRYLHPVPSRTIVEFTPKQLTEKIQLDSGLNIYSSVAEQSPCFFRTGRPITLSPLVLKQVKNNSSAERGVLSLDFVLLTPMLIDNSLLENLSFYFADNATAAQTLLLWFCHYLRRGEITCGDETIVLSELKALPVGLCAEEQIDADKNELYWPVKLLEEYFNFPEALYFVSLTGFRHFRLPPSTELNLTLYFSKPLPETLILDAKSLRLNCVPAVNRFNTQLRLKAQAKKHSSYLLNPANPQWKILSIDRVEGVTYQSIKSEGSADSQLDAKRSHYPLWHRRHQQPAAHFYNCQPLSKVAQANAYAYQLLFYDKNGNLSVPAHNSLTVYLQCTNGAQAAALNSGQINTPAENIPGYSECKNITQPSTELPPLLNERHHWRLIDNFTFNPTVLQSAQLFIEVLKTHDLKALYNKPHAAATQRRLAAITQVTTRPRDRLIRGVPIRGIGTTIEIKGGQFSNSGELYLFGCVLARFMTLYQNSRSFHQLTLVDLDTKEQYDWPIYSGQHVSL